MAKLKVNALTIFMCLGLVMSIIQSLIDIVLTTDAQNAEARADGVVTPEEDAAITEGVGQKMAGVLTTTRQIIKTLRS